MIYTIGDEQSHEYLKNYLAMERYSQIIKDNLYIITQNVIPNIFIDKSSNKYVVNNFTNKGNVIIGSYKQQLVSKPNGIIISTGGLNYIPDLKSKSPRVINNFLQDMRIGGVIEYKESFRHIQIYDNITMDLGYGRVLGKYKNKFKAKVTSVVFGDIHAATVDENILNYSIEITKFIKPRYIFLHDIFDAVSCNPYRKNFERYLTVKEEVDLTINLIKKIQEKVGDETQVIIVVSNHDDMLDRYIKNMEWSNFHNNIEYCIDLLKYILITKKPALTMALEQNNIKYIESKDRFMINGVLYSEHGNYGVSGIKGNITHFYNVSVSAVIGHSHSPAMYGDVLQVGHTCIKEQDYKKGLDNWKPAIAIVYEDVRFKQLVVGDLEKIIDIFPLL